MLHTFSTSPDAGSSSSTSSTSASSTPSTIITTPDSKDSMLLRKNHPPHRGRYHGTGSASSSAKSQGERPPYTTLRAACNDRHAAKVKCIFAGSDAGSCERCRRRGRDCRRSISKPLGRARRGQQRQRPKQEELLAKAQGAGGDGGVSSSSSSSSSPSSSVATHPDGHAVSQMRRSGSSGTSSNNNTDDSPDPSSSFPADVMTPQTASSTRSTTAGPLDKVNGDCCYHSDDVMTSPAVVIGEQQQPMSNACHLSYEDFDFASLDRGGGRDPLMPNFMADIPAPAALDLWIDSTADWTAGCAALFDDDGSGGGVTTTGSKAADVTIGPQVGSTASFSGAPSPPVMSDGLFEVAEAGAGAEGAEGAGASRADEDGRRRRGEEGEGDEGEERGRRREDGEGAAAPHPHCTCTTTLMATLRGLQPSSVSPFPPPPPPPLLPPSPDHLLRLNATALDLARACLACHCCCHCLCCRHQRRRPCHGRHPPLLLLLHLIHAVLANYRVAAQQAACRLDIRLGSHAVDVGSGEEARALAARIVALQAREAVGPVLEELEVVVAMEGGDDDVGGGGGGGGGGADHASWRFVLELLRGEVDSLGGVYS